MNHSRQIDSSRLLPGIGILFLFLVLGQGVTKLFHLPISGSVMGMVLLSCALGCRMIPLSWVEDASQILLQHLSLFFVPAGVGLLAYREVLRNNWIPIVLAILLGTMVTMLGTAGVHRMLNRTEQDLGSNQEGSNS
ncbi:MAG: CidA/LrgA family protein [Spirochaetes bacterium]|nr:CidA/LrgA family protein [Spirochaetota bacterium]